MPAYFRLYAVAAMLAAFSLPLTAQAYPSEVVDFTISGFGDTGSGSGHFVIDVATSDVLQFDMTVSGLTSDGFPVNTVTFNDPALLSHFDFGTVLDGGPWISFSYDTTNTSGIYATWNFHNRFYINDGSGIRALFATSVTSDVIDSPEPASLALLGVRAGVLAMVRRRRVQV